MKKFFPDTWKTVVETRNKENNVLILKDLKPYDQVITQFCCPFGNTDTLFPDENITIKPFGNCYVYCCCHNESQNFLQFSEHKKLHSTKNGITVVDANKNELQTINFSNNGKIKNIYMAKLANDTFIVAFNVFVLPDRDNITSWLIYYQYNSNDRQYADKKVIKLDKRYGSISSIKVLGNSLLVSSDLQVSIYDKNGRRMHFFEGNTFIEYGFKLNLINVIIDPDKGKLIIFWQKVDESGYHPDLRLCTEEVFFAHGPKAQMLRRLDCLLENLKLRLRLNFIQPHNFFYYPANTTNLKNQIYICQHLLNQMNGFNFSPAYTFDGVRKHVISLLSRYFTEIKNKGFQADEPWLYALYVRIINSLGLEDFLPQFETAVLNPLGNYSDKEEEEKDESSILHHFSSSL